MIERQRQQDSDIFTPKLTIGMTLSLGAPKSGNAPGRDLKDKFRFESSNETIAKLFIQAYGTATPTEVNAYLPYNNPEQTFERWFEEWVAGGLRKRCTGKRIVERTKRYETKRGFCWRRISVDEPCPFADAPECDDCGSMGRFYFYIPELYHAGFTQACLLTLTGAHNFYDLPEELKTLKERFKSLIVSPFESPGTLGMIPWVLRRTEKPINRPVMKDKKMTGDRTPGTAWIVTVSPNPSWLAQWIECMIRDSERMAGRQLSGSPESRSLKGDNATATMRQVEEEIEQDQQESQTVTAVVDPVPDRIKRMCDRIRILIAELTQVSGQEEFAPPHLEDIGEDQLIAYGKETRERLEGTYRGQIAVLHLEAQEKELVPPEIKGALRDYGLDELRELYRQHEDVLF